jgi:WD40 repeat protein
MLLVAAIASPTLLNLLAKPEAKEAISPVGSFSIPNVFDGDISPDGQRIAVATSNGIEIRDFTDGRLERRLGQARTDRVSWSPDGKKVAAMDEENLYVWDLASSVPEPRLRIRIRMQSPVSQPEWFPDSKRIATITQDGPLLIHDTDTGKALRRLDPPEGYSFCNTLSISPTSVIAAGCFEGHNALLILWNSTTTTGPLHAGQSTAFPL